jgi:tripartite-type tricarboxylate transporter receptor subunit TctC
LHLPPWVGGSVSFPSSRLVLAGFRVAAVASRSPKHIVNRLHAELKGIVELPEVHQRLTELGMIPVSSPPPEELQPFINSEIVRWAKIVRQAGLAGSE